MTHTTLPLKQAYCFSIDWLQLFCHRSHDVDVTKSIVSPRRDMFGDHREYYFRPAREFLHGYRQQFRVMYRKYDIATIAWEPIDARVHPMACAIKVANPVLYVQNWRFILEDVLACLDWQPNNITRCDLCCDFNKFRGGLLPKTFMRDYLQEPTAARHSYMRIGTDKFCIYGHKDRHSVDVDSIRWGSRQNGVSTYLYNKTLELQEEKHKPWIVEVWKRAGLVYDNPKLPVWRVEFSISSKGVALKDLELDQVHTLWLDDIDDEQRVRQLFEVFAAKFFRFVRYGQFSPKAKKDMPEVKLFDFDDPLPMRPVTLCVNVDSGRTERLVSKRLAQLAEAYDDASFMAHQDFTKQAQLLNQAADIFDEVANLKHYRREFDKADEVSSVELTQEYKDAISRLNTRDRLTAHIAKQHEFDFMVAHNSKYLKHNKLAGGGIAHNPTSDTKVGREEVQRP